jgi:hypothetical protein
MVAKTKVKKEMPKGFVPFGKKDPKVPAKTKKVKNAKSGY